MPSHLVLADQGLLRPGARATYVAHRHSGELLFAGPAFFEADEVTTTHVPLQQLLSADPSLAEVADLGVGWHAFRSSPADAWWSVEIPSGDLYLLSYETRPTEALPERDGIGGAFVNSWVIGTSLTAARERARKHLEDSGWAIVKSVTEQRIEPAKVPEDSRRYVRQAEVDGEVYVIHAYPPEAPDA